MVKPHIHWPNLANMNSSLTVRLENIQIFRTPEMLSVFVLKTVKGEEDLFKHKSCILTVREIEDIKET